MAELTAEDLVRAVNRDPRLQSVFTGAAEVATVGNRHHIVPSALEVTVGGTPVGAISTMQTFRDGQAYNLPETTGGVGMDLKVHFDNVTNFQQISLAAKYIGSASHHVRVGILEQPAATTYRCVYRLDHDATTGWDDAAYFHARTILVPNPTSFTSSTRRVTIQFYHVGAAGSATHDLWIDYLALVV